MKGNRLSRAAVALALMVAVVPQDAQAGRRPFIWTWDTEVVPQGDVELEQWLWARARNDRGSRADYWVWWGPVIGITNHFELALPFQVQASRTFTWLESFEVDARYSVFGKNDDGPFQLLFRGAYHQAIHSPVEPTRLELDAVASYGAADELHFTGNLGVRIRLPMLNGLDRPTRLDTAYAAGVAYPVNEHLRLAVEVFGEIPLVDATGAEAHHFIGPSMSWTRGRVWVTAGVLVGLTPVFPSTPHFMPRLIWAVVL